MVDQNLSWLTKTIQRKELPMAGYRHLEIVTDFERYVKDKKVSSKSYYRYMMTRLQCMFQYKNLPDTIPHEILDRYLFEFGIACITEVEGKLYAFSGNLGGPQDVYYRPTEFIISNPHVKVNGELFTANVPVYYTDDESSSTKNGSGEPWSTKGVLIRNDLDWIGLHPLIARYAYLEAENILTLRTANVMLRVLAMITAPSDKERSAALEYLKSLEKGELAVIGDTPLVTEGVRLQSPPSNNGSYLTQFIECQQYLKGSFFNEVGLTANYNMKREAIGTGESTLDSDSILPLCDNMLLCRKEDLAKVNEMFGTNIEVEFSSAWLRARIEMLQKLKASAGGVLGQPSGSLESLRSSVDTGESGVVEADPNDTEAESNDTETGEKDSGRTENLDVSDSSDIGDDTDSRDSELDSDGNEGSDKPIEIKTENQEMEEDTTSRINDLSQDEKMTEMLENINSGNDENVLVNQEEEGEVDDNGDARDKESSEDKGDNTEN